MARGHVRRRGNSWSFVVYMPADGDGKRRYKWHSGFETKSEAQRALSEFLEIIQPGTQIKPSNETLSSYLRQWLEGQRARLRPSTWSSYRMNIESYVIPRLGAEPLQGLTAGALNKLYAVLLERGRVAGGGLSHRSVRYVHTILRKALADALRESLLVRNVAVQAQPPRRNGKETDMRTWSAEELRVFLEHVRDDRLYAAWLLAATTGMRRGEILGLRWRDVDLENARLSVTQTIIVVGRNLVISSPKTDRGRRSIAIDDATVAALRARRRAYAEERLSWGKGYMDNDLAFAYHEGSPIHPDSFTKWFDGHVGRAGVPPIRLHDLRHTHATLALAAGVHPKVVQERLGHSSISITLDTYSHAIPALQEEAAAKVARLVFGA